MVNANFNKITIMKRAVGLLLLFLPLISESLTAQSLSGVNILGTPNISLELTGNFTGVLGAAGNYYKYEWRYSPSRTLLSSTTTSYTILPADNGQEIYFKVSILNSADSLLKADSSSTVLVNSIPVGSNAVVVGDPRPGLTLWANYVLSDADGDSEGGSTYQWYKDTNSDGIGASIISLATSKSYKVKDSDAGSYIGFKVIPGASTGSTPGAQIATGEYVAVTANDKPVASGLKILGTFNVNDVLTGNYTYSDYEGDLESGSTYEWTATTDTNGIFSAVTNGSGISHQITMDEQGMYYKFSVIPKSASGTTPGDKKTTWASAFRANSKPIVTYVHISGKDTLNETLTAVYSYQDIDGDPQGTSIYQWYRDSDPILGATSLTYKLTIYDVDKMITFKVIPVSGGSVYPNTGDTFASTPVGPVEDPAATPPVAANPCISGIREVGQELIGDYTYINSYAEKDSRYIWFRGKTVLKEGKNSSDKKYKLVDADINQEIIFAVVPKNERQPTQVGDTAFSPTLAIFDLQKDIFSATDSAQILYAKPMGGTFSGIGVTNGYFYPEVAGPSATPYTLKYVFTTSTLPTCAQTAYKDVEVRPIVVEFLGVDLVYCDKHGADTIYVLNVPPLALYRNFSISSPAGNLIMISDTSAVFYPDLMNSGDKIDAITYSYIDGKNFVEIKAELVIDHIGEVTIRNLEPGTSICNNATPFELFTSHIGGIFTGPVLLGKLDPSLVPGGFGDAIVTYTYVSLKGCSQTAIVPITVDPVPVISFVPADFCIIDESDSTRMVNNTVPDGLVKTWLWEFSESGITTTSSRKEPAILYKKGGDHRIFLTATTESGCTVKDDETFDLGVKPEAGFTWKNECFHPDDSVLFFDATVSASAFTRRWIFNGVDIVDDNTNPGYPKTEGYMTVKLLVSTGYAGCDDSITRNVYIRPTISIPQDGYSEDFESGKSGWTKGYEQGNIWTFDTPSRPIINSAASGDSAWVTEFDILAQKNDSSSVVSPCFDFTSIVRPMIKLKLWKRFDLNRDGAALQYKIGDSGSWEYVGTLEDGIKWFNSATIKGRPGGEQIGWTSRTSDTLKWEESSHKIDELQDKKDVKFRIVYGSDGTSVGNDGVAFDDIWIGERTRSVLLEHFANTSILKSSLATEMVNDIALNNTQDVINIQYHTNFPGSDPYYNDNPGDASARILYYGLLKAPYTFIDGGNGKDYANLFDYVLADIDGNDVNRRSLVNPIFNITLNSEISGGILTVSGQIRALEEINTENLTLYIAVTEKENNDNTGANGETTFYNVFRKLIPDAGGINLNKTWTKGEVFNFSDLTWVISKIQNSADIEVIAFVQNNISKELYQASSQVKLNIVVGIEKLLQGNGNHFALYPNPAVNKLTVSFKEPLNQDTDIRIYDMRGIIIASFKAGSGTEEYMTENLGLKPGIYLVRVSAAGLDLGFRKLIISSD